MSAAECSLELVKCERVTSWPTGLQLVTILGVLIVGGWAFYRSR
jgi:hypothetical protein